MLAPLTRISLKTLRASGNALAGQPTVNDMLAPLSQFSAAPYKRRFGGFRKALEAFVAASQGPSADEGADGHPPNPETNVHGHPRLEMKTRSRSRSVGWRLRYLVLQRDRFCCQACGKSPSADGGTVLRSDHVAPWSRGGSTVEANLQTLCERCNIGKGATQQMAGEDR